MGLKARFAGVQWEDESRNAVIVAVEIRDADTDDVLRSKRLKVQAHALEGVDTAAALRAWVREFALARIAEYKRDTMALPDAKMDRLQGLEGEEVQES